MLAGSASRRSPAHCPCRSSIDAPIGGAILRGGQTSLARFGLKASVAMFLSPVIRSRLRPALPRGPAGPCRIHLPYRPLRPHTTLDQRGLAASAVADPDRFHYLGDEDHPIAADPPA